MIKMEEEEITDEFYIPKGEKITMSIGDSAVYTFTAPRTGKYQVTGKTVLYLHEKDVIKIMNNNFKADIKKLLKE